MAYDVAAGVAAALNEIVLTAALGFGGVAAPVMYSVDFVEGSWGRATLKP